MPDFRQKSRWDESAHRDAGGGTERRRDDRRDPEQPDVDARRPMIILMVLYIMMTKIIFAKNILNHIILIANLVIKICV